MIESTSRPWKPTSVNLVASTFTNGASASLARRRATSVLPQPVGPIIRMFFGTISVRRASGTRRRLQRARRALATARLASGCPTMWRSRRATTSEGVKEASGPSSSSSFCWLKALLLAAGFAASVVGGGGGEGSSGGGATAAASAEKERLALASGLKKRVEVEVEEVEEASAAAKLPIDVGVVERACEEKKRELLFFG